MKNICRSWLLWLVVLMALLTVPGSHVQAQEPGPPSTPLLRVETGMHTAPISRLSTDARGRYVVTASEDKTVRVWDAASHALLSVLRPPIGDGYEGRIDAVALSPDGQTVVCGGFTDPLRQLQSLYVFDRATGQLRQRVTGLPDVVLRLTFSPDGRFLAATLGSGGVRLFRTGDFSISGQDANYSEQSDGASFGVIGGALRLVTSCYDGQVRLYDVGTDGTLSLRAKSRIADGDKPYGVAFSPNGSQVVVGFIDKAAVAVVSGNDLSPLFSPDTTKVLNGNLAAVAWSADGQALYAGGTCYDVDHKFVIFCWTGGGRGKASDGEASARTLMDLQQGPAGGFFFAAADPGWGVVDSTGKHFSFVGPATADLRFSGQNWQNFRVSPNASTFQFEYQDFGKAAAVFSLPTRALILGGDSSVLQTPIITGDGLDVQGWKNTTHLTLNGKAFRLPPHEVSRSLALAPDHQSFLLGADYYLHCLNANGTLKWNIVAPGEVGAVNVSGDGRLAMAAFGDGTIRWFRMTDGRELLAFFPHADRKRWVLWTPSGYYDCSPGGEDLIGWHVNHGRDQAADFFPASRFRDTFYRPDVVSRVLTTLDEKVALQQADDAAVRKATPVATAATVTAALPPVVTILAPESGAAVSADSVTIRYSLRTPGGKPVTEVRALVDGRPVGTPRRLVLTAAGTSTAAGVTREITVTVPHQDCTVSLLAVADTDTSEAATVRLAWKGDAPAPAFAIKPTLYVLAIGVSTFAQSDIPRLTYPAKDAKDFAAALLGQKGRLYADVQEKVLTDGDATKSAILDGLDWIQHQTTQHDVAMVFLSGHGANDSSGSYLFIPTDFSRDHVKSTGLAFSDIRATVEALAGKTLFFVDSCHSGNVMGTAKTRDVDITGAVNELSSAENGAIVFAASTGSQVALEDPAWGNGAFTKALVEALDGKADYNHDGKITVNMLDLYVSDRVKELTDGSQTPTTTKPETVPDFPIILDR